MAKSYLDKDGLLYFWQKIKNLFVADVTYDSSTKKIQKTKAGTASDVVALSTVATSGSYNDLSNKPTIPTLKNVFGKVKVGSTTIEADTTQDTLEIVAGSNVTVTPDATNDKITIAATDTKYTAASETPNMDGTGAVGSSAKYAREDHVHPSDTSRVPTTRKVNGHALSADVTVTASDIGVESGAEVNQNAFSTLKYAKNSSDTVKIARTADSKTSDFLIMGGGAIEVSSAIHSSVQGVQVSLFPATSSQNGYMSSGDKAKLDSLTITNGVIDASNLPSYVDDVIEAYVRSGQTPLSSTWLATGSASGTVITPETGKIYVLMADSGDYAANTQFRWGGTAYVKMSDGGVSSITNAEIDTIVAS